MLMVIEGWRDRLLNAVRADGRPHRTISLKAGLGPNFVSELHHTNKNPRIQNVLKLAAELNLSLSRLFLGVEATPEDEKLLAMLQADPRVRQRLLALLDVLPPPEQKPLPRTEDQ